MLDNQHNKQAHISDLEGGAARWTCYRAVRESWRRTVQGGCVGEDQRGVPKPSRASAADKVCRQIWPSHSSIPWVRLSQPKPNTYINRQEMGKDKNVRVKHPAGRRLKSEMQAAVHRACISAASTDAYPEGHPAVPEVESHRRCWCVKWLSQEEAITQVCRFDFMLLSL